MVISATARVAAKILAKQRYAETARLWRKKNPDKIKAQKKRYYAAHKEQLKAEQRQWRKDNPEKVRQLRQAARERHVMKTVAKPTVKPTAKPTTGVHAVWLREQKSQGGSGTTVFSSFLQHSFPSRRPGTHKTKPKYKESVTYKNVIEGPINSLVKKPRVPKRIERVYNMRRRKDKPRKYGFGYEKLPRLLWHEAHPKHKKLLSLGGIFGGLAAYANWNRGKKQS